MKKRRLLKLADFLETVKRGKFDMNEASYQVGHSL